MKSLTPFKRSASRGANYYVRFKVRSKTYLWCTKTDELWLARKRGKNYHEHVIAGAFGLVDRMNAYSTVATFDELIDAYLLLPSPALKTRQTNTNAMRAIMAANGLSGSDSIDRLSAQTIVRYQQKCVARSRNNESAVVTCNGRVRCARSMFSKRALVSYDVDLKVPEDVVRNMFKVPALREAEPRRELPSEAAAAKAHTDLPAHPEHYRAFLLARYAGLRAGEIKEARRDWLDGELLYIGGRTDQFNTKSRKWRVVALPTRVAELLMLSDDPVYLVGPNRNRVVNRELPDMLQAMGFPEKKPLHSTRRLYGSVVYTEQGPRQARDALGHSTQAVTDRHYARSLDAPKSVAYAG
jgi:integrase